MEYVYTSNLRIFTADVYKTVDAANSLTPSPMLSRIIRPACPKIIQVEGDPVYITAYDNSKQADILGIKFRTKLETTKDLLEDFSKRGW